MPGRVLYVNSSGDFHGAERCLLNLLDGLDRNEFEPVVALPFPGIFSELLEQRGIDFRILPLGTFRVRSELYPPRVFRRMAEWIPGVKQLAELIREEGIQLVHSNTSAVLAGALAARLTGTPHLWHVRESIRKPLLPTWISRSLVPRLADEVLCISRTVQENFAGLAAGLTSKIHMLHDGVDIKAFAPSGQKSERREPVVGMIARVNPYKGHELFLRAAQLLVSKLPAVRFIMAGPCAPEYSHRLHSLHQLCAELGLNSHVSFPGSILPDHVPELLQEFDVFVLPSTEPEGLSQVVLEAMASAKPVIATRVGGPEELVVDGETGFLVPPGEPRLLAEAMRRLLENPQLRGNMGEAGRQRAMEKFSIENHQAAVFELYRRMLPLSVAAGVPIVLSGVNIDEMKEGARVAISRNATVLQNPNHLYCELGEEAVLLNLSDGVYYGLDPIGARIWALLREPKPVHVLCEILLEEFDVELDRCEAEVLALLQELADCRLVEVR